MVKLYILPAIVLLFFGVAFYPAIDLFIDKWSASDDYTHAFFAVPIAAYMIWQKRHCLIDSSGHPVSGIFLIVFSVCFYLLALDLQVPTIIFFSTILTIVSILIYFGGFSVLKKLGIPILLLFMVIPIPNQLLSMVTATLQLKVSEISDVIIQLFSVPVFREGNVIEIPGKAFQVVDACSGIRSLISLSTLSLIISYFTLTRVVSASALFLFALPVAVCINICRVVSLVLAYYYLGIDLAHGTPHTILGLVLFGIGLGLLFAFQRILERWEIKNKSN